MAGGTADRSACRRFPFGGEGVCEWLLDAPSLRRWSGSWRCSWAHRLQRGQHVVPEGHAVFHGPERGFSGLRLAAWVCADQALKQLLRPWLMALGIQLNVTVEVIAQGGRSAMDDLATPQQAFEHERDDAFAAMQEGGCHTMGRCVQGNVQRTLDETG